MPSDCGYSSAGYSGSENTGFRPDAALTGSVSAAASVEAGASVNAGDSVNAGSSGTATDAECSAGISSGVMILSGSVTAAECSASLYAGAAAVSGVLTGSGRSASFCSVRLRLSNECAGRGFAVSAAGTGTAAERAGSAGCGSGDMNGIYGCGGIGGSADALCCGRITALFAAGYAAAGGISASVLPLISASATRAARDCASASDCAGVRFCGMAGTG